MSSISIKWDRRAVRELRYVEAQYRSRVFQAVTKLADDPLLGKPLSGEWKGLRRLRVGKYRVIYAFDGRELLVSVIRVGHRRAVHR